MTAAETLLRPVTPPGGLERGALSDHEAELKRGAWTNVIALLASNFRGIFTFLVARLLGPAALGVFSVAWATTDLVSKIGIFGLNDTITTFIARAEAAGDRARSRALFRLAVLLGVGQCAVLAVISITLVRLFGRPFGSRSGNGRRAFSHALRNAGGRLVSDQHRGVARDESDAARHFFARAHRNDRDDSRVPRRALVWPGDIRARNRGHRGNGGIGCRRAGPGGIALSLGPDPAGRFFLSSGIAPPSLLRRADQRLRSAERRHRSAGRRDAGMLCRTRPWRDADDAGHLRRGGRSRRRPAQDQSGVQSDLRADRGRPDCGGDQDMPRPRSLASRNGCSGFSCRLWR